MSIQVETTYTKELLVRFSRFSAVRTPAQVVIYLVLELWMLALGILLTVTAENQAEFLLSIAVITPVFLLIIPLILWLMPVLLAKLSKNLCGNVNTYVFSDAELVISSSMPAYSTEGRMQYGYFVKVYETSHAFYLFISQRQAFLLDKTAMEPETALQLRQLLQNKLPAGRFVLRAKP